MGVSVEGYLGYVLLGWEDKSTGSWHHFLKVPDSGGAAFNPSTGEAEAGESL